MGLDNRVIVPVLLKDSPIVFCVECGADWSTLFLGVLQTSVHQAPRHRLGAGRTPRPPGQHLSMLLSIFLTPFSEN